MQNVKLLTDVVDVARTGADRWYVTNGATAVGPVNLELLARGVEAGKVPISSFVRHEAWKVWRPLSEIAEITPDEGDAALDLDRASGDFGRGSIEPGRMSADDVFTASGLGAPANPAPSRPWSVPDLGACAADRRDALILLLDAAVSRGHAEGAIIYEVADDGAVAVCARGPQVFEVLGLRTKLLDPALIAAAAGAIVVSEPSPGPAGQAILERLCRLGTPVESAVMLPIRPHGRLFGTIEIGRRSSFCPKEVAGLEALVEALVFKLEEIEARRVN